MLIVNIIDILFYRAFLSKIYLTAGVDYRFLSPDAAQELAALDPPADAVLVQDSYAGCSCRDLLGIIRETGRALGRELPILCLRPFEEGAHQEHQACQSLGPEVMQIGRAHV